MSNSNYLPQQQVTFPENFIVILIHGWTETASNMNTLVNTMRGLGSIESYWNCVFPDITITKDDLPGNSNVFSRIQNEYNIKANANVFIKIAFTHEEEGPVIEQSEELADVIEHLRAVFPTKKIATVGYSKGGVVAMECAVDYPGYIDNLISVATPYTTTIAEHLYGFVADCLQSILNGVSLLHILNHPAEYLTLYVLFATNTVENLFRNGVVNDIIQFASGNTNSKKPGEITNSAKIINPLSKLVYLVYYKYFDKNSSIKGSVIGALFEWECHNAAYELLSAFDSVTASLGFHFKFVQDGIESAKNVNLGSSIFTDTGHGFGGEAMKVAYMAACVATGYIGLILFDLLFGGGWKK